MLRLGMMGIALAIIGCGGSHTLDDDAGGPEDIDAALLEEPTPDVRVDDDAGIDAFVEAIDAAADAPGIVVHASCTYYYGAECRVPCSDPPDVPIELFIDWSEPYCCEDLHFGTDDTHWSNCRCIDGLIQSGSGTMYALPRTWCDLCGIEHSGPADAYVGRDAGP